MPMQPSPSAETMGPFLPSLRFSIRRPPNGNLLFRPGAGVTPKVAPVADPQPAFRDRVPFFAEGRNRYGYRDDPLDHPDPGAGRRPAHVAPQSWMGLLPDGRHRRGAADPADPDPHARRRLIAATSRPTH